MTISSLKSLLLPRRTEAAESATEQTAQSPAHAPGVSTFTSIQDILARRTDSTGIGAARTVHGDTTFSYAIRPRVAEIEQRDLSEIRMDGHHLGLQVVDSEKERERKGL